MPKIVVFGANGFIGRHLVKKLATAADNHIIAFDRFPEHSAGQAHSFSGLDNVEIISGDFLNRADTMNALNGIEYVFHLISTTNPAVSANDPYVDIDTNIRGSVMLFESCVQNNVKRVIFPSSGGTVYGDASETDLISETTLPAPVSPYGIGKLTIEHYLRYFKRIHGLDYITLRIANPYGPGQNVHGKQGVIPIFLHAALTNQPITLYGDGEMIRDYIYIDDLVSMIYQMYDQPHEHDTYNIGSGHGSSVNNIVQAIEKCAKRKLSAHHQPAPSTFVEKSVLSINRYLREFDIGPRISITDGISATWNYLQDSTVNN